MITKRYVFFIHIFFLYLRAILLTNITICYIISIYTNCMCANYIYGGSMSHIYHKRPNTKLEIVQLAAKLFIEEGYSKTTFSKIAKTLDLSTGNITFYFKTKEHLLAVLAKELFDFQNLLMEEETNEGMSSLLSYCLELTTIASVCKDNEIIKDFYVSCYSSQMILDLIRENDKEKTKNVFKEFNPDWTDEKWIAIENIVSGIEFATIMTSEKVTPLDIQIKKALKTILTIYNVPKDIIEVKINKVLNMDYRSLGNRILNEFKEYINKVNEEKLNKYNRGDNYE